jgi:hypothetical protein
MAVPTLQFEANFFPKKKKNVKIQAGETVAKACPTPLLL